jgi:trafficking protein particle complex subunit 2
MCAKEYRLMFISFPQFFRKFHAAYVDAVSNPFHVPGKKIASRSFGARVSTIVKSFGSGTS